MAMDSWYNSDFGRRLGIGAILVGLGIGAGASYRGCSEFEERKRGFHWERVEKARIYAASESERVRAIEELARQYGDTLSSGDFVKMITDLGLNENPEEAD